MICPRCGMEIPADSRFCTGCGEQLSALDMPKEEQSSFREQGEVVQQHRRLRLPLLLGVLGTLALAAVIALLVIQSQQLRRTQRVVEELQKTQTTTVTALPGAASDTVQTAPAMALPETETAQTVTAAQTTAQTQTAPPPATAAPAPVPLPTVSPEVKTVYDFEGTISTFYATGDFAYVDIAVYEGSIYTHTVRATSAEAASGKNLNINVAGVPQGVILQVTPYSQDNRVGRTVSLTAPMPAGQPPRTSGGLIGDALEINTHGEGVNGFTTEYVTGGEVGYVRKTIGDGWHVTCTRMYTSRGVEWAELYDADDGDYYGWVDSQFIDVVTNGYRKPSGGEGDGGGTAGNTLIMEGRINTHGEGVNGFTTEYVSGGEVGYVRRTLGNGWHVYAVDSTYCYGITWYELYDADDGDYYGWVDSSFVDLF